jgi:L-ascorbate metabolism protein UlaG (beta-lactamase superfamily)
MQQKPSDHHNGKRFFNTTLPMQGEHSFFTGMKMWFGTPKEPWPEFVENTAKPELPASLNADQVAITFINHVTFLIQIAGLNILTDPIWSKRASPFSWLGPARVREPALAFADLPKIDVVIVSHNHYDHLDLPTLKALQQKFAPLFLVAAGDKALLQKAGCVNVQELDWWDEVKINNTTQITFTPTQHFSARTLWDRSKSLWGSYVIDAGAKLIYFGGDAGYSKHYADIYKKFGPMDIALLGIGAYEPTWFMRNMHMTPADAVQAHLDLHSKHSIGMHYGTFKLSAEGIDKPVFDLKIALQQQALPDSEFITMEHGATNIYTA